MPCFCFNLPFLSDLVPLWGWRQRGTKGEPIQVFSQHFQGCGLAVSNLFTLYGRGWWGGGLQRLFSLLVNT